LIIGNAGISQSASVGATTHNERAAMFQSLMRTGWMPSEDTSRPPAGKTIPAPVDYMYITADHFMSKPKAIPAQLIFKAEAALVK